MHALRNNPFGLSLSKPARYSARHFDKLSSFDGLTMRGHFDKLSSFDGLTMRGHFDKLSANGA